MNYNPYEAHNVGFVEFMTQIKFKGFIMTRETLNELSELIVIWTEFDGTENKKFSSFGELESFVKRAYESENNLPSAGYDKMKLKVTFKNDTGMIIPIFFGGLSRVDIGTGSDWNPFQETLIDHILGDYRKREEKYIDFGENLKIPYDFSQIT